MLLSWFIMQLRQPRIPGCEQWLAVFMLFLTDSVLLVRSWMFNYHERFLEFFLELMHFLEQTGPMRCQWQVVLQAWRFLEVKFGFQLSIIRHCWVMRLGDWISELVCGWNIRCVVVFCVRDVRVDRFLDVCHIRPEISFFKWSVFVLVTRWHHCLHALVDWWHCVHILTHILAFFVFQWAHLVLSVFVSEAGHACLSEVSRVIAAAHAFLSLLTSLPLFIKPFP